MKIPNGARADLGDKISGYCLNPDHPDGKHKARVFAAALGITLENADGLESAVLEACRTSDQARDAGEDAFGHRFHLTFPMVTSKGSTEIFTAWMIRHEEDFPRLLTCFVL